MDINFELYKVFYYVASTLSFSEASEKLYISQSAVSQSIKTLEEKLNCRLFFRNTKNVRLTKEGEMLFNHIEQAFNFIKAGEKNIQEIHSMEQGEVHIAASDTICKYYLMYYFKKFNELYPQIKLRITNRTSPKCLELLEKGKADFAVVNIPDKKSPYDLKFIKTKEIRDIFIAGENFRQLKDKIIALKELESYPILILEKDTTTRSFFDSIMKGHEVTINPEIELGSIDLLVQMAKIGLGISFVQEDCAKEFLSKGEIFKLNIIEKIPERYIGIATNRKLPLSAAAKKFIELIV